MLDVIQPPVTIEIAHVLASGCWLSLGETGPISVRNKRVYFLP